jgi:hypothetical protein
VFDINFYLPGKGDCRKPIKTPEEDSFTDKSVMLIIKNAHFRRFNRQKQSSDLFNAATVSFPGSFRKQARRKQRLFCWLAAIVALDNRPILL